ncbi:MAG: threonine/serine dehydratase [Acidobacteria bacterium]|nr:threonine/serine dehydratase [Acidobacteriota bacterium]
MDAKLIGMDEIRAAQQRIAGVAVRTGLYELDRQRLVPAGFAVDAKMPRIWIKAENEQPIGSFKLRGAYNKIASLDADALERGVITYSSGNHAQGVAYAARVLGTKAVIVMPSTSPRIKQEATKKLGGEVVLVGPASSERRAKAEELQREHGYTMVPPYDDDVVIAGAATCGVEILEQNPQVQVILSPVGGGGLLSGISTAVKWMSPQVQVFGVEPELAGDATESFARKRLVEWPFEKTSMTVADGLRTQSMGERNFAHVMRYADGVFTVSEEEILCATKLVIAATEMVAEPSGAVALACALFHWKDLLAAQDVAVVLSGGNLDPALKERLLGTAE